jgi:hypothetical protein
LAEQLARRWDTARPAVVATARHAAHPARVLAVRALLLALAGLAVACLTGHRYASRGAARAAPRAAQAALGTDSRIPDKRGGGVSLARRRKTVAQLAEKPRASE